MAQTLRIASIGCDASLLELLRAAQRRTDVSIVAGYGDDAESAEADESDERVELRRMAPPPRPSDGEDWEALLSGAVADIVFFGHVAPNDRALGEAGFRDRDEMLRRLIQAMVPLVVVHPPCEMLLAYELQMIRHDTFAPVFPYVPWIQHSAVKTAVDALQESDQDVQQLVFERYADALERTEPQVLAHVARDALVLRRMMGDIKSVSATAGAVDRNPFGNLAVHLMGEDDTKLVARWSIGPKSVGSQAVWRKDDASRSADAGPPIDLAARLTLVTDERSGSVELFGDRQSARCQLPGSNQTAVAATEPLADQFLADVVACVRDRKTWPGITWEETCRSLEITDAIQRSLKRRRTIELYHEQVTEHDTFKSVMAAGGCGMLLWVMMLLMIAGVVEGLQLPIRGTFLWRLWPLALITPLAAFLGLQFLQLVFKRSADASSSDPA